MFFGLVIGVMLSLASASVLSSSQLREQRSTAYAADGATDAAIQIALRLCLSAVRQRPTRRRR